MFSCHPMSFIGECSLFVEVLLCPSIHLLRRVSFFMIIYLNSLSGRLLISAHRSLFSGDLLFIFCCCYHLFIWECIPLSPCVYLHVKIAQSCLTLCDSMNGSLPGSFVHRIFQARILEWVAISFSRGLSTSIR